MKKIIGGKKYDTNTAECVGSYSNMNDTRNFYYWREALYKKKTGEFFLFGEGGPASKYNRQINTNEWAGSEEIRPLTESEAKEWAEQYLDGDDYENIFGEVEE